MREIFASKNMIVKIALILAIIILIEFTLSCRPVQASVEGIGGTLLKPIISLVVSLADGVINIVQSALFKIDESFVSVDIETGFWEKFLDVLVTWIAPAILIVGGIVVSVATAGTAAAPVFAVIAPILTKVGVAWGLVSVGYYVVTGNSIGEAAFGNDFTVSTILISPETILSNKIDFFNIDFIDEPQKQYTQRIENQSGYATDQDLQLCVEVGVQGFDTLENWQRVRDKLRKYNLLEFYDYQIEEMREFLVNDLGYVNEYKTEELKAKFLQKLASVELDVRAYEMEEFIYKDVLSGLGWGQIMMDIDYDKYTHLEDFENIADFVENCEDFWNEYTHSYSYNNVFTEVIESSSISNTLHSVIGQVYKTVRDICALALLIVIIYIFIRRIMSVSPTQRNDLTQTLINCFVGLCLIFTMHIIMTISLKLINTITTSVFQATQETYELNATTAEEAASALNGKLNGNSGETNPEGKGYKLKIKKLYEAVKENPDRFSNLYLSESEPDTVIIINRNFLEEARFRLQEQYETNDDGDQAIASKWNSIGWSFVYIVLVIFTLAFILLYGKRVLFMAALTMFASIVGVMYPLNKMRGEARAHSLNTWIRQYMGNLVIQPLHLFIYTVLIGSAMAIAINNPIYVIIALMGILYIERLLKNLMGIPDDTMGGLGSALNETTRAIRQGTDLARQAARTTGRLAGKGIKAGAGLAVGAIDAASAKRAKNESNDEDDEPTRIHTAPENPELAGDSGSQALAPIEGAGSQTTALSGGPGAGRQTPELQAHTGALPPHDDSNSPELVASGDGYDVYNNMPQMTPEEYEARISEMYGDDLVEINDEDETNNGSSVLQLPPHLDSSPEDVETDDSEGLYPDAVDVDFEPVEEDQNNIQMYGANGDIEGLEEPFDEVGPDDMIEGADFETIEEQDDLQMYEANEDTEGLEEPFDEVGADDMIEGADFETIEDDSSPKGIPPTGAAPSEDLDEDTIESVIIDPRPFIGLANNRVSVGGPREDTAEVNGHSGVRNFSSSSEQHEIGSSTQGDRDSKGEDTKKLNGELDHPGRKNVPVQQNIGNGSEETSSRPRIVRTNSALNQLPEDVTEPQQEQEASSDESENNTSSTPQIEEASQPQDTSDRREETGPQQEQETSSNEEEKGKSKKKTGRGRKILSGAGKVGTEILRKTANGDFDKAAGSAERILDTAFDLGSGIIDMAGNAASGNFSGMTNDVTNMANTTLRGADRTVTRIESPSGKKPVQSSFDRETISVAADNLGISNTTIQDVVDRYDRRDAGSKKQMAKAMSEFRDEIGKNNRNSETLALAALDCVANHGGSKEALENRLKSLKDNGKISQREVDATVRYMEKISKI